MGAQYYEGAADTKGRRQNSPIWKMVKSSNEQLPTSKKRGVRNLISRTKVVSEKAEMNNLLMDAVAYRVIHNIG